MSRSSSDRTNDPPGIAGLSEDDRHRVLSAERRRVLLDALAELATPVDVERLAAAVASREGRRDSDTVDCVERIAVTLHHQHLPRLDDLDVVDYDRATNRVVTFRRS